MDKLNLIIWDTDSCYSKALGTYITNTEELFLVKVLHDKESLLKHAAQETGDIFLVSDMVMNDSKVTNGIVIHLVDQLKEEKNENALTGMIFKYKEADEIVQAIKYYYEALSGNKVQNRNGEGKLIGFFSSAGGTGKTVISLGISRVLASYGKKVLYLNLESIPSSNEFFSENEESKSLSDFLYYLFIKEDQKIIKRINSFIRRDEWGVHCFVPQSSYNDLMNLTSDEIQYFISALCSETDYDYICVDTSGVLDEKNIMVHSMCHKNFNILTQSKISRHKQKIFNHYCEGSSKLNFYCKSIMVMNRCSNSEYESDCYTIGEDEHLGKGIYLNGPFGDGLKRMVENILFK
ncbi:MAG: hypothetical protein MJA31_07855 [Clostridia bacterium]|nr:hypothetical protein [Clostridia bacterium]